MFNPGTKTFWDVAVIGAGPAGLSAAIALKKAGIRKVVVIDRESSAGGIPRHCGHHSFGMIEYFKPMTGPDYARNLAKTAAENNVEMALKTSVISLGPNGNLTAATPKGMVQVKAQRILLATGARETPRSARLISGGRMMGITTTGALQSMVYLKHQIPFRHPVIVGSEMVSLSALFTCKKAGIFPVALLEQDPAPNVPWPLGHAPRFLGIPLHLKARVSHIWGQERVSHICYKDKTGQEKTLECDGILFTGQFTPESSLMGASHLLMDPTWGSPKTDRYGRCSDPAYFAAGNLMPPLNMAMNCWRAGKKIARFMVRDLRGTL